MGTASNVKHILQRRTFRSLKWKLRANNISWMVIMIFDGILLGDILLEIKLANHLKGGIHGSVHVHKSKYFFRISF